MRILYTEVPALDWAARERVIRSWERAEQHRLMARHETRSDARDRLLDLARQYDVLAVRLEARG